MPSTIPARRKRTGRRGVWDRLQCSEKAGAAPGLAARGHVGTAAEVAERS